MKIRKLYIIYDNELIARSLQELLENKFGNIFTISAFDNNENVLKNMDLETEIVILAYDLKDDEFLQKIKKINPETEVIILSDKEDIAMVIDSFYKGESNYIAKREKNSHRLFILINKIVNYPVKVLVERFSVNKILAIFITYFLFIGVFVYLGMLLMR